ncbi:hypothetical protein CNYM01_03953 [Colletotrichum nymphaeae SA-01]|uniref:Subtelomeric hrmA-associated cluster protein AFUB-079030/YDR124W-like helical bundle domain-containing protein n=1 Tax=Colletotrichum nymphaeae SA-01 TaxID=1460502 RepID=A0A135TD07_9PEZI|nr:hypothetical protein CNYM01_03953 [Colletotrichum nymphaeae SA-01]
MVRDYNREPYPRQWPPERFPIDHPPPEDGRYHEARDARRPPMDIEKALRDHCNIPAKRFFMVAVLDDGSTQMFMNTPERQPNAYSKFFNLKNFVRHVNNVNHGSGVRPVAAPVHDDSEFSLDGDGYQQAFGGSYGHRHDRRRLGGDIYDEDGSYKTRKRHRAAMGGGYRRPTNDDDDVAIVVASSSKKTLKVGDEKDLWNLYEQRFKNCQQTACKLIAKAWVKVVEPKKQTNHPYTGQDEKAPDWWPKPWGPTKEEKVRHKEPDHLYKRERVHLLCHILRMIVEPPEKQHPAIRKMNLSILKLEEATTEAMSAFFADKENKTNAKKKPYLDEIFKVAKMEERYKNGEVDGDAQVFVMSEDKFSENYPSDNEDNGFVKEEDEHPSITSSVSPSKTGAPHDLLHNSTSDHSPTGPLHGGPYMSDMPMRGQQQYSTQMLSSNMHPEHHFVETNNIHQSGMPLQDLVPTTHDPHRRASLYTSPTEYSTTNNAGIYSQPWQGSSAAPGGASVYSFTPQQPGTGQGHFANPSVPLNQNQYIPTPYDNISRSGFDQVFRPVSASQTPVQNSQGFPNYLPTDTRGLPGSGGKAEALARGQMH